MSEKKVLVDAIDKMILANYLRTRGDERTWEEAVDFALKARNSVIMDSNDTLLTAAHDMMSLLLLIREQINTHWASLSESCLTIQSVEFFVTAINAIDAMIRDKEDIFK